MSERLDHNCKLDHGARDAVHVPIIASMLVHEREHWDTEIKPGMWVKFTDETCHYFVPSDSKEGHGIINPFLGEATVYMPLAILVRPGITSPVRHHFDVDFHKPAMEKMNAEFELEERRKADPGCADCWEIVNGEVIRY